MPLNQAGLKFGARRYVGDLRPQDEILDVLDVTSVSCPDTIAGWVVAILVGAPFITILTFARLSPALVPLVATIVTVACILETYDFFQISRWSRRPIDDVINGAPAAMVLSASGRLTYVYQTRGGLAHVEKHPTDKATNYVYDAQQSMNIQALIKGEPWTSHQATMSLRRGELHVELTCESGCLMAFMLKTVTLWREKYSNITALVTSDLTTPPRIRAVILALETSQKGASAALQDAGKAARRRAETLPMELPVQ
jgi:hypothetical protein